MSKQYIWLTDTHFNFVDSYKIVELFLEFKNKDPDGIFLTGDISNGPNVTKHLRWLQNITNKPIYFVLGNHDFYRSTFHDVEQEMLSLMESNDKLHWLTASKPISLTNDVAVIGHDGWYDSGWHTPRLPIVFLADWYFIKDFRTNGSNKERVSLMKQRAQLAAEKIERGLLHALDTHSTVYLLTHFPPWPPVKEGIKAEFWRPFNSSKILADMLLKTMGFFPDKNLIVLAGHTHENRYSRIAGNIELKVGQAELKQLSIGNIITI